MHFIKLLSCTVCVFAIHLCSPVRSQVELTFYQVVNAAAFNGSSNTATSDGCDMGEDRLDCDPTSKLDDGITGPMGDDYTAFFAFSSQSSQRGELRFIFNATSNDISLILYFFNYPEQSIGLPLIYLTAPVPDLQNVSYTFDNNNDLSQTDTEIRSVVLHLDLSQTGSPNFVTMAFDFSDTNIDWFLISEVDFNFDAFTMEFDTITFQDNSSVVTLQQNNIPNTHSISCTVVNSGSFVWQWLYNGDMIPSNNQIKIADATRTSILIINDLNPAGVDNYSCIVRHQNDKNVNIDYTRVISLVLQDSMITTSSVSTSSSASTSTIASLTTSLIVNPTTSSSTTSLNSNSPLPATSTMPPTSSTMPPASSSSDILPIAIGVAFGVVFLVMAICVAVLLIVLCSRKKKHLNNYLKTIKTDNELTGNRQVSDTKEEKESELTYSVIVRKSPPAIPPQNFDPASYSEVDLGNDTKPHLEWNNSSPKLAKVTQLVNFDLVDNPIYDASIPDILGDTQEPYYSCADYPIITEATYSEIPQNSIEEATYSTPDYLDYKNPLYNGYNDDAHDQPFSFVSSSNYSDGPIYSVPEKTYKRNTIIKINQISLQEIKHLGFGQFGEVILAKTSGLSMKDLGLSKSDDNKDISMNVAVKKVKVDAEDASLISFEKEMKFVSQLKHKNVVQLLAVSEDGCEPFMVMEYMENGDLNQFLLWHHISKSHPPNNREELSPQNLLSMVIQVASGMAYLASHNYIHRDIATRNCLVGEDNVIKIADFGLSRSLYDSVYYRVKGKAKMPIRWMATECFYGKFSQFSDVWAYGVTVWEIYTMGREPPYPTLDDQEILEDALKGVNRILLTKPSFCPNEVYKFLCSSCFTADYRRRATFSSIHSQLSKIENMLYD